MIGEAFIVSGQMPQLTELCRLILKKIQVGHKGVRWDVRHLR